VDLTGAALLPQTSQIFTIPGGDGGVKATLRLMVRLVKQYKLDLNVRNMALDLTGHLPPKDRSSELTALQHFCRDRIRYVNDVDGVETIQTPVQTLNLRAGDCDDKATLLCALAASIGFATRFCAIGVRGEEFSHVMAQARLGDDFINCETIISGAEVGWFPPDATSFMMAHC
jgi:transglutaminase-like putative cysteine protease